MADRITLHQLSTSLDIPERRLRHKLRRLAKAGKLREEEDFTKEQYQDQFHFTYMVDPLRFVQEAKLEQHMQGANKARKNLQPDSSDTNEGGTNIASNEERDRTKFANSGQQAGSESASRQVPPDNNFASNEPLSATTEDPRAQLVDFLIDQVKFQNGQLERKDEELQGYRTLGESYKKVVLELMQAKDELRSLGPGTKDQPIGGSPSEKGPIPQGSATEEMGDNPIQGESGHKEQQPNE